MNTIWALLLGLWLSVAGFAVQAEPLPEMTVYRSPTCSCCEKWLAHVKAEGFAVKDIVTDEMQAIKEQHGVSPELASCHTALVGGYVVEGHVPASDIKTLLKNKPTVKGLSVPGMPVGTPGMDMNGKKGTYDVVSFGDGQKVKIYQHHDGD